MLKIFILCFNGFPYVIAPVFSTPAFSIRAMYSCIFYSCIFYFRIFSAPKSEASQCYNLRPRTHKLQTTRT